MELEKVRRYHLHKQQLDGHTSEDDMLALVRRMIALHSTDYLTPYLSLFARLPGFHKLMLFNAINQERSLVRVNAMRTTVFVVAADMLPVVHMSTRRQMRKWAETLTKQEAPKNIDINELRHRALTALEQENKTTVQLKRELGISSSILWLIRQLMADGLIVRAEASNLTSNIHRFALIERWLPDINLQALSANEAYDQLLLAYINLFGPVSSDDMAWWSGLSKMEVAAAMMRLGRADRLRMVDFQGNPYEEREYFMTNEDVADYERFNPPDKDTICLLPYEDHFAKGYIERAWYLDRTIERTIISAYGEARPTIWLNGEIIGWWEVKRLGATFRTSMELLKSVSPGIRDQIEERRQATERFLNE